MATIEGRIPLTEPWSDGTVIAEGAHIELSPLLRSGFVWWGVDADPRLIIGQVFDAKVENNTLIVKVDLFQSALDRIRARPDALTLDLLDASFYERRGILATDVAIRSLQARPRD